MSTQQTVVRAGIAGAAALAAGSSAYAAIVPAATLPANMPSTFPITPQNTVQLWDVNGDATNDFVWRFVTSNTGAPNNNWAGYLGGFTPNAVVGYVLGAYNYGNRLTAGALIGPASGFANTNVYTILGSRFGGTDYGQFQPPNQHGFVGFKFLAGATTLYGWAEVTVGRAEGILFTAAYYEDSGAPINAGATPAPGALGLLAFGASALLRRNKRRVA